MFPPQCQMAFHRHLIINTFTTGDSSVSKCDSSSVVIKTVKEWLKVKIIR